VKVNGGVEGVRKRIGKPGTVDVGIIDAGIHGGSDLTVAAIGFVHEFGATINHPGGTPYVIVPKIGAIFVEKGHPSPDGITQPHRIVIPERSFMRSTLREKRAEIIKRQKFLWSKVQRGVIDRDKALGLLGETVSDMIRRKIVALKTPPNAPATIRAKRGKANPLIDTAQLKNSITYKVNR
jgi:hypothetical protein